MMGSEICAENDMVIGGTLFQHKAIHKYTWTSPDGNIYNQIDYIICHITRKQILKNARSYAGTLTESDHRIVITEFEFNLSKMYKASKSKSERQYNSYLLRSSMEKREEYSNRLKAKLEEVNTEEMMWESDEEDSEKDDKHLMKTQTTQRILGRTVRERRSTVSEERGEGPVP